MNVRGGASAGTLLRPHSPPLLLSLALLWHSGTGLMPLNHFLLQD